MTYQVHLPGELSIRHDLMRPRVDFQGYKIFMLQLLDITTQIFSE